MADSEPLDPFESLRLPSSQLAPIEPDVLSTDLDFDAPSAATDGSDGQQKILCGCAFQAFPEHYPKHLHRLDANSFCPLLEAATKADNPTIAAVNSPSTRLEDLNLISIDEIPIRCSKECRGRECPVYWMDAHKSIVGTYPISFLESTRCTLPYQIDDLFGGPGQECGEGVSEPYEIVEYPGKGKGLRAVRDIELGEIIVMERPLLIVCGVNKFNMSGPLGGAIDLLKPRAKKEYLELFNCWKGEKGKSEIEGILQTNGMRIDMESWGAKPEDGSFTGIFPVFSRMNNSCMPNCQFYFSQRSLSGVVRAVRPIKKGEELEVHYLGSYHSAKDRQALFQSAYKFTCTCPACDPPSTALPTPLIKDVAGPYYAMKKEQIAIALSTEDEPSEAPKRQTQSSSPPSSQTQTSSKSTSTSTSQSSSQPPPESSSGPSKKSLKALKSLDRTRLSLSTTAPPTPLLLTRSHALPSLLHFTLSSLSQTLSSGLSVPFGPRCYRDLAYMCGMLGFGEEMKRWGWLYLWTGIGEGNWRTNSSRRDGDDDNLNLNSMGGEERGEKKMSPDEERERWLGYLADPKRFRYWARFEMKGRKWREECGGVEPEFVAV
ncbi:SET domain-containing protein [Sistotremastrum niveocremeum HHB9708]|uniref:SET domain-containing protein n=1 Tax=Sistotremastrum niveocremeum HHB9708 TaxID=1314777 RepID=A0A164QGM2_9AGAM|nr:SET domain-containing protein [Sistotremastrum niveocremeum HHB9708]